MTMSIGTYITQFLGSTKAAKLQTLGLPAGPVARINNAGSLGRPRPRNSGRPDTAEYGASGTPIFGGFLRERGEYNPRMIGLEAISTYEEMRRSDAQVAATLMAIKHPIRAAQWDVTVDDDASPVETEAAEFVRTCLFKEMDFSSVLRNALLMLDFGVAARNLGVVQPNGVAGVAAIEGAIDLLVVVLAVRILAIGPGARRPGAAAPPARRSCRRRSAPRAWRRCAVRRWSAGRS